MEDFYIYAHIRPDTGTIFYIGKGRERRAFSKSKRNKIWMDIVNKNKGYYKIEFLFTNLIQEKAFEIECKLILEKGRLCNGTGLLSNLTLGGEGTAGFKLSEEHKNKISRSGEKHHFYGKKHSEQHKLNMSKALLGKKAWNKNLKHNEETKEKIRQKAIGRPSPLKGSVMSENQKKYLSKIKKGKAQSTSKLIIDTINKEVIAESMIAFYNKIDCRGKAETTIRNYLNGYRKKPDWFHYSYL